MQCKCQGPWYQHNFNIILYYLILNDHTCPKHRHSAVSWLRRFSIVDNHRRILYSSVHAKLQGGAAMYYHTVLWVMRTILAWGCGPFGSCTHLRCVIWLPSLPNRWRVLCRKEKKGISRKEDARKAYQVRGRAISLAVSSLQEGLHWASHLHQVWPHLLSDLYRGAHQKRPKLSPGRPRVWL